MLGTKKKIKVPFNIRQSSYYIITITIYIIYTRLCYETKYRVKR